MRKDGAPLSGGFSGNNPVGRFLLCFETTPVVAILLAVNVIFLVWNLHPYYHSLFLISSASSACHCTTRLLSTGTTDILNATSITTNPLVSLSALPTPDPPRTEPNKRKFKAYGNAAALFVQMGAYRGGPATFAVVGLASKPAHVYGNPWYKCEWVPLRNGSNPIRAKAYKILPDWGYGRVYTVVVVNCTFPTNPNADNTGGRLTLYAYYSLSSRNFEKFTALEESPGSYDASKFNHPFKYNYLYCGSSLFGNINPTRIREWIAYHAWFFGPESHFVFHDAGGVTPEVMSAIEPWVRLGRVTVQNIRDQERFDGYYYNQFLVVNDCLHRYRFAANWTFFFDVDEYLYLPEGGSLESVLDEFEGFSQFTFVQNAMSSKLCLNDSAQDLSRQWGFEKLVFRDSRTRIRRDRKYAIQARNAYATGVHMSENVVGRKTLHKTDKKILYYHYHNSIQVPGEPCREFLPTSARNTVTWSDKLPYVYDENMKKLADKVKQYERQTLRTIAQQRPSLH